MGHARAVAVPALVPVLRQVLAGGTLYDYAQHHRDARPLAGRQPAYAIPLPNGPEWAVVRHNRHGGLLAPLTGDRFVSPTRAPHELALSLRLAAAGVPTPRVLGYVVYRAGAGLARADVVTQFVDAGRDLAAVLAGADPTERTRALHLAAALVSALSRAGARHADLNAKNILVANQALVLDVDRVEFGWGPSDALAANLRRLDRSLRKRREHFDEHISDTEIADLARMAAAPG